MPRTAKRDNRLPTRKRLSDKDLGRAAGRSKQRKDLAANPPRWDRERTGFDLAGRSDEYKAAYIQGYRDLPRADRGRYCRLRVEVEDE
jgi:hypothetical protein